MTDIRSFFSPSPAAHKANTAPASSPAESEESTAPAAPAKKRKISPHAATPAAELRRAKKLIAATKKAKKAAAEAAFVCAPELLAWTKDGTVHAQVTSLTTNVLKGLCQDNGLKYGGPKYELVKRLLAHGEAAVLREKKDALVTATAGGDEVAAAELAMAKFKSFEAAVNLFKKRIAKLDTITTAAQRLDTLIGLSFGFDAHLLAVCNARAETVVLEIASTVDCQRVYCGELCPQACVYSQAITGPRRGQYNGKHGEKGIDGHCMVARAWHAFLTKEHSALTVSCSPIHMIYARLVCR